MKMTIEWHQNCLAAQKLSLDRDEEQLNIAMARLERNRAQAVFYESQIKEAISKKKDAFDAERFGMKNGSN